jgi:hypothetical protein
MKWVYCILIVVCFGVAVYDITISSPYFVLWAMSSIIYTIFFVVELICDKIDDLYEKISNNSK